MRRVEMGDCVDRNFEGLAAKFRDWRSRAKMPDEQLEEEVSYLSRLAEFIGPVPLSKITKAVIQDFYLEEQIRVYQEGADLEKNMDIAIVVDDFLTELRASQTRPAPGNATR
jgi:hypothetical protein